MMTPKRNTPNRNRRILAGLMLTATLLLSPAVFAQTGRGPIAYEVIDWSLASGTHDGTGEKSAVVTTERVEYRDADYLRVHFSDVQLSGDSYLIVTSVKDGRSQFLNRQTLAYWQHSTAVFDGDAVDITLHAAPGSVGNSFAISALTVATWSPEDPDAIKSLCGGDNRSTSTDAAVGRIFFGGCTAWMIANGAFLTAGHCADFDPDGGGALLPDGVLDLSGVVEFNVPLSTGGGRTVPADPSDQYPINMNMVTWRFDGAGQGLGKDWSIFAVNPSDTSGLLPHQVQNAFYRVTTTSPSAGTTMRITGYGVDSTPSGTTGNRNTLNMTEQTSTGGYLNQTTNGPDSYHSYQVDTEGANSGSPIIRNSNGVTIGIHTNAGCGATSGNSGTAFDVLQLQNAINDFWDNSAVHVDIGHPYAPITIETGSLFRPFDRVVEGVSLVPAGGLLIITKGSYNETMTITKAMLIRAPVGNVYIGQ